MDLATRACPLFLLDLGPDWLRGLTEDPLSALLIFEPDDRPGEFAGFATLENTYPEVWQLGNLLVTEPGRGHGQRLIRAALDEVFGRFNAHRLYFDVAYDNHAGLRAFDRAGLVREGVMRQCWKRQGEWVDCISFSLLASEWRALPRP